MTTNINDYQSQTGRMIKEDGTIVNISDIISNFQNSQGTLLASSSRVANTSSPIQTNNSAKGIVLFLNVTTASGTGGLMPKIQMIDPVTGTPSQVYASPAAATATGQYVYVIYPGNTTSPSGDAKQHVPMPLPRTWQATVYANDNTAYIYTLGYALIL